MSSTIDFVSPYGAIAQRHKDGLDAILVSIGAGGPGTVTVDDLMDAVYAYLVSVYTTIGTNPQGAENVRATIANAINGYIQNGGASPYLRQLQSVPVTTLITKFDRMADAMVAAPVLKGNASRALLDRCRHVRSPLRLLSSGCHGFECGNSRHHLRLGGQSCCCCRKGGFRVGAEDFWNARR